MPAENNKKCYNVGTSGQATCYVVFCQALSNKKLFKNQDYVKTSITYSLLFDLTSKCW